MRGGEIESQQVSKRSSEQGQGDTAREGEAETVKLAKGRMILDLTSNPTVSMFHTYNFFQIICLIVLFQLPIKVTWGTFV